MLSPIPSHRLLASTLLAATACLSAAAPASAHTEASSVPELRPLFIDESISVDGHLDDDAWQQAEPSGDFRQREPQVGAPATERTVLRAVFTNTHLYIGIMAYDSEPSEIIANEMERDAFLFRDDSIGIFLDTFHDHRNAFFFETNPNGARTDALLTDEGRDFNVSWDGAVWDVKTHISDEGWSAEFAIPFSTLRFDPNNETWGMQVRRIIKRKNEETYWSPLGLEDNVFRISKGGHFGPFELRRGLNIEIKPYASFSSSKQAGTGSEEDWETGLDFKWGINEDLTLDVTANTDFAEAEVDDQQVNLTRFPLFFQEKREFFLESAGIFEFGPSFADVPLFKVFFSRRVGISDDGRQVPIDFGGRLTGRAGGWSLGLMNVRTDSLGSQNGAPVPENDWGVVRVKRNLGERSSIGMIYTRSDTDGGNLNEVYGIDLDLKPTNETNVWAFASRSDDSEVDEDEPWNAGAGFNYDSALYDFSLSAIDIGKDFNPDAGFLLRRGVRRYRGSGVYEPRPVDHPRIRNYRSGLIAEQYERDGGGTETSLVQLEFFGLRWHTEDELHFFARRQEDNLQNDFPIFPGVTLPAGDYDWWEGGFQLSTSDARRVFGFLELTAGDFYDGSSTAFTASVSVRASRYFRTETTWVRSDVSLPVGDFDFDVVRQRLELSFTPDLSLNGILQYNSVSEVFGANLRLRWTYRPGSDLYVVYNENWNSPSFSDLETRDRQVIVKMTYLFRL